MLFFCFFASLISSHHPLNLPKVPNCQISFFESFPDHSVEKYWIPSDVPNYTGAWQIEETVLPQTFPHETALVAKSRNSYSAISTKFKKPLSFVNQTLVIQYEMRPQLAFTCSGAYIKLFSDINFNPSQLTNETQYTIMFGPDRCQSKKIHFIYNHYHPKRHAYFEKAMKQTREISLSVPVDVYNHLYTLIVRPNNTFSILIDNQEIRNGSLFFDFDPPLMEPREIDDPDDFKPSNWVDVPYVVDSSVKKPDDWDDRKTIPDPSKLNPPDGWLLHEEKMIHSDSKNPKSPLIPNPKCSIGCGKYEPPEINNPNYQGRWKPKLLPNPQYKGEWKPRKIKNPYYFVDLHPHNFPSFTGVGFEIWHVNRELAFKNILIANDENAVKQWNEENFIPRKKWQLESLQEDEDSPVLNNKPKSFKENFQMIRNSFADLYNDFPNQIMLCFVVFLLFVVMIVGFIFLKKRKFKTE